MTTRRGGARLFAARLAAFAAATAASLFLGACARSLPPPGGPLDTTPPRVLAASPADSAVNVGRGAAVEVLFSEGMDRATVRDNARIYPPTGRPVFRWSGRRVRAEWPDSLQAGTTYHFFLSGRARDLRGVPLGVPLQIRFSTGATLAPGRIQGRVRAKTLPTRGVPILLFPEALGLRPDTTDSFEPSYQTETDTSGVYEFTGLPVDRGFTVLAFYDRNGDYAVDPETDVVAGYGKAVRLTPERTVADSINILAVDPKAPAVLSGTIVSPDSTARFTVQARAVADSSVAAKIDRVGPGPFALRVPPGKYHLEARRNAAAAREARAGLAARGPITEAFAAIPDVFEVGAEDERGPFVLTFPPTPPAPPPARQEEPR